MAQQILAQTYRMTIQSALSYSDALPDKDPQIRPPSALPEQLALDRSGELQCTTCHNAHDNEYGNFLVMSNRRSKMCISCHNGSVAKTNLKQILSKRSGHNVSRYDEIHDLKETSLEAQMHVECVDCHNPHSVRDTIEQVPVVPGPMHNISGITSTGSFIKQAQYEYEVCFKCHGDNPNRLESTITRTITQTNTRLEFDVGNPSFHPVISPGINRNVPSLIKPLTSTSMIYCIDCHNSDEKSRVKGPHASSYSPLLEYNYETADFTQESEFSYALCYKCHSRNSILNDESFPYHSEHLKDEIPCSACHDAHGISKTQGSIANNSHLINFDISIVSEDSVTKRLEFEVIDTLSGRCFLNCHNKAHSPLSY